MKLIIAFVLAVALAFGQAPTTPARPIPARGGFVRPTPPAPPALTPVSASQLALLATAPDTKADEATIIALSKKIQGERAVIEAIKVKVLALTNTPASTVTACVAATPAVAGPMNGTQQATTNRVSADGKNIETRGPIIRRCMVPKPAPAPPPAPAIAAK